MYIYIKQINDILERQKKRWNSVFQQKKVMFEIHLLNACKKESFFDFYVESIVFRIKIVINITF